MKRLTEVRDADGALTHQMCCICFKMRPLDMLWLDDLGEKWDICSPWCAQQAGLGKVPEGWIHQAHTFQDGDRYTVQCGCGWWSDQHPTREAARAMGDHHLEAENTP